MRRLLLLMGIAVGFTAGWLVAGPPAPRDAQASPAMRANSNPPGKALTGAPSEGTCAGCHGTGDNTGSGLMTIIAPSSYSPGQTYAIVVGVGNPGATRWGFEMTALTASNAMAGTFANVTDSTGTQTDSGTGRIYENQVITSVDGTMAGTQDAGGWAFLWTAPGQGTGTVTFYGAGVAANNDNSADSGDFTYTTTAASTETSGTPVQRTTWGAIKNRYR
jgi:hypothetical protein